jgi:phosphatidylglycerophosphate synthase
MLSSKIGHFFDKPLSPVVKFLNLNPNFYTITGLILNLISAYVVITDFFIGGVLLGIASFFDMLDGISARVNACSTRFGAFLDSFIDRVVEGVFFLCLGINFILNIDFTGVLLAIVALILSYLISYIRARAEGLGIACKVGLIERPERIILLLIGLLFDIVKPVLFILCFLSFITVIQRFVWVYKSLKTK